MLLFMHMPDQVILFTAGILLKDQFDADFAMHEAS